MHQMKFKVLALLVMLLAVAGSASATLYLSSGKYVFHVQVTNSSFKDIQQARGRVYISGNSARIDVEADGYRSGYEYVSLRDNVTSYTSRVRLDEPTVWISVIGSDFKPVNNCSTSFYSQNMYWADEFGFTGQFPKAGFEKLTARDFIVRVNSMSAFAPRVYLTANGDSWRFEIVVKRRDMNSMFANRFEVVVKCDPDVLPPAMADLLDIARDYMINQEMAAGAFDDAVVTLLQSRLESDAIQLISSFAVVSGDEQKQILQVLPADGSLARQLKAIVAFDQVHH